MGKHEPQIPPADGHETEHEAAHESDREADYEDGYEADRESGYGPEYGAQYEAATEAAPVLGPRQAAARSRSRRKRALVVASAAGLTLVVGGTAAAAVIVSGGDPQNATNAAGIPQAQTQTLTVEDVEEVPELAEGDEDRSQAAAPQALTASGAGVLEEPEEEEEPEAEAPSGDAGGSGTSEGTGEGGTCQASFYGDGFHGATTANGETFDTNAMTAAHKTLPFDTMVKVTNPNNGSSVTVRINDRGPYIDGRCLDLSTAAFDQIIGTGAGVGTVEWEVVG
ncbi:septal ring lytic transglycosylase RlpA family protein [Nocardiopsis ganjiahuensis]|uniref:septal ring lytic transglycosylase RlpA family protein n=1 Tax=Nocardiopsis ganjiahuensis TaxID=239984 RepID=UPI000347C563|nr:septal ring lytic transglycosylase RlpA family protein [Nocardiopsis ganjiahuensis]